mmetsp:Transcript_33592/g.46867  ORF Transcript_33592/g.46867 Transcript_33592/m.46867 type:complete len:106 (-) Transcript_33592:84-401(-)
MVCWGAPSIAFLKHFRWQCSKNCSITGHGGIKKLHRSRAKPRGKGTRWVCGCAMRKFTTGTQGRDGRRGISQQKKKKKKKKKRRERIQQQHVSAHKSCVVAECID